MRVIGSIAADGTSGARMVDGIGFAETHGGLSVRRIVRTTVFAMYQQAVNLVFLGVQQGLPQWPHV